MSIKILVYHKIVPAQTRTDNYYWSTTVAQLRNHLTLLTKWGYETKSLRECVSTDPRGNGRKLVVLTFDDGYENVYHYALPVLKEFRAKATFFVLGDRSVATNNWDDSDGWQNEKLMSDENVVDLDAQGFEVGSHSLTHRDLTTIAYRKAEEEIRKSKAGLQELIHGEVVSFAYPLGATNSILEKIVEYSGYTFGCGVYSGPPRFGRNNFNIRRIPITRNTNSFELAFKVLTPYEYYAWMRWKVGNKLRSVPSK